MVQESPPGMRALERGLTVIRAFTESSEPLSLSEVARRTDLDRAVVRRVLGTLRALAYAEETRAGWRLTPAVLELGYAYLSSDPRTEIAEARLKPLADRTHESCSLGVLHQHRVVYLARVEVKRVVGPNLAIGSVLEPTLTSIGRLLLAYADPDVVEDHLRSTQLREATPHSITDPGELRDTLARVRHQGYCLVAEELELGLLALAVPVYGRDGRVVCGVNLTSHTTRMSPPQMVEEFLPLLQEIAEQLSQDLRHAYL